MGPLDFLKAFTVAHHVLIVDDDPRIRHLLSKFLAVAGFLTTAVDHYRAAIKALSFFRCHLVLMDVMLPDAEGFAIMKEGTISLPPVIFLTARNTAADRIKGLSLGGADYLPKPFEPEELLLRSKRLLKPLTQSISIGAWQFDKTQSQLLQPGRESVPLAETEVLLLERLVASQGQVLAREALSTDLSLSSRSIDVLIQRLRKKMQESRERSSIQSVRGVGYRLLVPQQT